MFVTCSRSLFTCSAACLTTSSKLCNNSVTTTGSGADRRMKVLLANEPESRRGKTSCSALGLNFQPWQIITAFRSNSSSAWSRAASFLNVKNLIRATICSSTLSSRRFLDGLLSASLLGSGKPHRADRLSIVLINLSAASRLVGVSGCCIGRHEQVR